MSKVLRRLIVDEMSKRLKGVDSCVVLDYQGMSAQQAWEFRSALHDSKIQVEVVKNTTAAVALKKIGKEKLTKLVSGPTAIVFGGEDAVAPSKKVLAWRDKMRIKKPVIRGGYLDGQVLSPDEVVALSKTPSREVLLSILLGTLQAPIASAVGVLAQIPRGFVTALNHYAEKRGKDEGGGAAPTAPDAAPAADAPAPPPAPAT